MISNDDKTALMISVILFIGNQACACRFRAISTYLDQGARNWSKTRAFFVPMPLCNTGMYWLSALTRAQDAKFFFCE